MKNLEVNPCSNGEPLMDKNGDRISCIRTYSVKLLSINLTNVNFLERHVSSRLLLSYWGQCPHNYVLSKIRLYILDMNKNVSMFGNLEIDVCEQPLLEGAGGLQIPRWYYDKNQNR